MNNPKVIVATLFSTLAGLFLSSMVLAQTNPLWTQEKVRNYLPHMSVPEVEDFLETSDLVIIPVGALEQRLVELADLRLAGVQLVEAVDDHVVREHHRAPPAQLRPGELRR